MTNLQGRQRAPQKQLSRCLEDGTRIELSLSEISDEAVNEQMESNCLLEIISSPRWLTTNNETKLQNQNLGLGYEEAKFQIKNKKIGCYLSN
jgi:hypothetical protein